MSRVMLYFTLCFFLAASSFISTLNATGKFYMHFWLPPCWLFFWKRLMHKNCSIYSHTNKCSKKADNKGIWEMWHATSSSAEDFHLPLCQPISHMVSLEKEGCPTCHLVETSICSGHCITKVPVMVQAGVSELGHRVDWGGGGEGCLNKWH